MEQKQKGADTLAVWGGAILAILIIIMVLGIS